MGGLRRGRVKVKLLSPDTNNRCGPVAVGEESRPRQNIVHCKILKNMLVTDVARRERAYSTLYMNSLKEIT